jgi:ferrous-iron efflux pump FieF
VTCTGVLAALLITKLTGWQQADAVLALVLALWIGINSVKIAYHAFQQLIDRALPEEELVIIRGIIDRTEGVLSYHKLRTRLAGSLRQVDVHIVVPAEITVVEGHRIADSLEKEVMTALHPTEMVVHVDPFDENSAEPD